MSFETRWSSMSTNPESPAFQRIDALHPLDFYLGREPTGEWVLLLVSDEASTFAREHAAIHVVARRRQDGRYALVFRLVRPDFGKLFSLVCEDLVESTRNIQAGENATSLVMKRFARWQKLLEQSYSGLLDDAALRGLLGELLFLEKHAIPGRGVREAVTGWVGPTRAERDFVFPDHEYEIKTIHSGSESVLISSAEQLDVTAELLDLVVVQLDEVEPGRYTNGFTALGLVERIKAALENDTTASLNFEEKLIEAGFIIREEYGERTYVCRRFRHFHVGEGFPAIRRSELPPAVGNVKWELQLPALAAYELTPIGD